MEKQSPDPKPQTPLGEQIIDYVMIRVKLFQYQAIDQASTIFSSIALGILKAIVIILLLFFLSLTLAIFLSQWVNSYWEGFGMVALLYFLLFILIKPLKFLLKGFFIKRFVEFIFRSKE